MKEKENKIEGEVKAIIFDLRLKSIHVTNFLLNDLVEKYDKTKYPLLEFGTAFTFEPNIKQESIKCFINIKTIIKETKELMSEITIAYDFYVSPIKKMVKTIKDNKGYTINNAVLLNIISISGSTSRGILHEKLKDAPHKDVFPILDLKKLKVNIEDK